MQAVREAGNAMAVFMDTARAAGEAAGLDPAVLAPDEKLLFDLQARGTASRHVGTAARWE